MKIELDPKGQIYLKKLISYYIPLGKNNEWKEHFNYNHANKTFYLQNNTWYSLTRAVAFLEHHCRVEFNEEFFKVHFKLQEGDLAKMEEEAKNISVKIEGSRVYYSFKEGFEKYAAYDQLTNFKKWHYTKKFTNEFGRLDEYEVNNVPVSYEKEKTVGTNEIVFSTSIGFSTLFFDYLHSKGFVFTKPVMHPITIEVSLISQITRDYQREAIQAWSTAGTGIIVSPSASGKTYMGAMAIASKKVKTLVLVHTKDLIGQWETSLVEFLDLKKSDIGKYDADYKQADGKVIIATYQTLVRHLNIVKTLGIGLVIADECHRVPAETFRQVNDYVDCRYKLGLTATPNRPDKKDGGLYAFYDKIVYEIKAEELLEDKYISPTIFYTLLLKDLDVSAATARMEKEGYNKTVIQNRLKEMSALSGAKHEALETLIEKINKNKLSYIIFADRIQAAKVISDELGIQFLSVELSMEKRDELFRRLREKEISGVVSAKLAGEGVDIPGLDVVIDLIPSRSNITILQKIGRIRRRTGKKSLGFYIQFVLENVAIETRWANAAYSHFFIDTGSGMFVKRRVVYFPKEINFGIKRSAKATEHTREHRIELGNKTEQELLEFLKANPDTYLYDISKKLNWSRGKVTCALDRLEKKGVLKKEDYLKNREPTKIKVHGNVIVCFDGACTVNPGGITSYGFCVYDGERRIHRESKIVGTDPALTNNYAEYAGLCAALEWLLKHGITNNITIKGDSRLVIDQMNGTKAARGGVYIELFDDASRLVEKFHNIKFKWIPGEENTEAHALSKQPYELKSHQPNFDSPIHQTKT